MICKNVDPHKLVVPEPLPSERRSQYRTRYCSTLTVRTPTTRNSASIRLAQPPMRLECEIENLAKRTCCKSLPGIGQSIVCATMLLRSLVVCGLSLSRRLFLALAFTQPADGIIMPNTNTIRILIHGGDNMLGRAVQLSFPVQAPGDELIRDSCTAEHYLTMALHSAKPTLSEIRKQNENCGRYLWGKSRFELKHEPDVCLLNLETAVTKTISNSDIPIHKGINYHMHVDNFETIMAGFPFHAPVVVCFANNHSLDFGRKAFEEESLPLFDQTSLVQMIGGGRNFREAARPALIHCDGVDVEIFAVATGCSGTPRDWWATESQSGIVGLPSLNNSVNVEEAMKIIRNVISNSPTGNNRRLRILSIHWGPNWALKHESDAEIQARRDFAHRVIDECGVDLIYGHSSHHIRGIERYKQKLILYGAGDIINDYEGFENPGEEHYVKLGGIFVVDLMASGELRQLQIVPMLMNQLRLERYTKDSLRWNPNMQRYDAYKDGSKNLCEYINRLSLIDADNEECALCMKHENVDSEISGGPVLRSEQFIYPQAQGFEITRL